MIDPDKLPASAVEAVRKHYSAHDTEAGKLLAQDVATFLDALLADDDAIARAVDAYEDDRDSFLRGMRAALTAAVSEPQEQGQ